MSDINVATVSSSQPWQGRLIEFFRDHGVNVHLVHVISEARTAYDHAWQVVIIDATSSLMNPTFVADVHSRGRGVLAVWNPQEPGTKERALDADADELIECEAVYLEFVARIGEMAPRFLAEGADNMPRRRPAVTAQPLHRTGQLIAVGGPAGAPTTPTVLGMARTLAERKVPVLVADVDELGGTLAQLLDLPPVPNLASAVATARKPGGRVDDDLQVGDGYYVLGGLLEPNQWAELGTKAVLSLLVGYAARFTHTIAVVGPVIENVAGGRFGVGRAVLAEADTIVAICEATPVGLIRLTQWVSELRLVARSTPLHLVAADAPSDRHRQNEVLDRLDAIGDPAFVSLLPRDDARLSRSEWQGTTLRRGPLHRAVSRLTDVVSPKGPRR